MKVYLSPLTPDKRFWKRRLDSLPGNWFYLSAGIVGDDLLSVAGVQSGDISDWDTYRTGHVLWDACEDYSEKQNASRTAIRIVPAIDEVEQYTQFEVSESETWGIPFKYRSIEIQCTGERQPSKVVFVMPSGHTMTYKDGALLWFKQLKAL